MRSLSPIFSLIVCALISLSTPTLSVEEITVSFYIAYQWPGSYCAAAKHGCCYPKSSRIHPSFTIGGIWPYTFSGDRPTYCKSKTTPFSLSKISNLTKSLERNWPSLSCPSSTSSSSSKKLWMREWQKYGTCAESLFGGQYQYFHAALNLRKKVDLLKILSNSGIHPNGSFYNVSSIFHALQKDTIYLPSFACNEHKSGNKQLYQIILTRPITESDNICPTTATKIAVVPEFQTTAKKKMLSEIVHYSKGTTDFITLLCHCLVSDNSYFVKVVQYFFRQ